MFASPKLHHRPKSANLKTVERTLTSILVPLMQSRPAGEETILSPSKVSPMNSPLASPAGSSRNGNHSSYSYDVNDSTYIVKEKSVKRYRVLSYKIEQDGSRTVFDILTGKIYFCGLGSANRANKNVLLYESKDMAMSEKFPIGQVGASKTPRLLISFDAWGHVQRRHGGGSSAMYEHARFMTIEKYLDPQEPYTMRSLPFGCKEPFYFAPTDVGAEPSRNRTDALCKKGKTFSAVGRNPQKVLETTLERQLRQEDLLVLQQTGKVMATRMPFPRRTQSAKFGRSKTNKGSNDNNSNNNNNNNNNNINNNNNNNDDINHHGVLVHGSGRTSSSAEERTYGPLHSGQNVRFAADDLILPRDDIDVRTGMHGTTEIYMKGNRVSTAAAAVTPVPSSSSSSPRWAQETFAATERRKAQLELKEKKAASSSLRARSAGSSRRGVVPYFMEKD